MLDQDFIQATDSIDYFQDIADRWRIGRGTKLRPIGKVETVDGAEWVMVQQGALRLGFVRVAELTCLEVPRPGR